MVITISCPSCLASFPVDTEKVPEAGVNARCSSCSDVFRVERPAGPDAEHEPQFADTGAEFAEPEQGLGTGFDEAVGDTTTTAANEEWVMDDPTPGSGLPDAPSFDAPAPEPDLETSFFTGSADVEEPAVAEEPLPSFDEPVVEEPLPSFDEPVVEEPLPSFDEPAAEEPLPSFDEPAAEEPAAAASEAAAPVGGFSFGQRDPLEKAKRLARVLVSDMIMYNPERHERALANGTLKEDFEEEIEKSWKEYIEQVGEELAEGSDFWKEALNDVLAKGEPVF